VPQVLWFRRWYGRIFSLGRQRRSFFPGGRPLYMYAPWWMSHGVSLFWTFGIKQEGLPDVTRTAGMVLGAKYLVSSGLFHVWQQLRALRIDLLERLGRLRPYERRLRLAAREVHRQGVVDWTGNHLKPYVGAKARKKAVQKMKKRARQASSQAVRGPGLAFLNMLRHMPLVRKRVVPSLLKHELDQVPAAPIVAAMTRDLERLGKSGRPILIGPWISEVGFEVLYWIPFLNWALREFRLQQRQLIVVSRGGARLWYRHLGAEYVDVFDLFTVEEYRARNEERWSDGGNQKQFAVTGMEREILDRAKRKLGIDEVELLHPSVMYKLLQFFWFGKASVRLLTEHAEYCRLVTDNNDDALAGLPKEYVAVRFYFRPSFPETPENRRIAADIIRSLSEYLPVVLLNTGLNVDDHEDVDVADGKGVYRVDHLMTPQRNLEIQTRVISHARAFVGTYGGLTYLGPCYGVPSIGLYSHESELIPAHLDVGWRLGRAMAAPLTPLHVKSADTLRMLLGLSGPEEHAAVRFEGLPAASAGPR
jgi:hypothetical protein